MILIGLVAILLLGCLVTAMIYKRPEEQAARQDKQAQEQKSSENAPAVPTNPLHDVALYVDPDSDAANQAKAWRVSSPQQAAMMDKLAAMPTAKWLTSAQSLAGLEKYLSAVEAVKAVPILVAYNLPLRDCGQYSAGGARNAADYNAFIDKLASLIGNRRAVVILEPDALAGIENGDESGKQCLSGKERAMYYALLNGAVARLKAQAGTIIYVDAGHSGWMSDGVMAGRLQKAGVAQADGFSLNVSNFQPTADLVRYGKAISSQTGGKHFVIDTSRNGVGAYHNTVREGYDWCNPPGRALGHFPTVNTGEELVDAYLYIKLPGQSDGQDSDPQKCFGGPAAGEWWPQYALGLIERWPRDLQPR